MSVRVSTLDDDPEDNEVRGLRNASSLSSYNLPRQSSQKKGSGNHCIYISVICILLLIIVAFFYRGTEKHYIENEVDEKLEELSKKVSELQGAESANEASIRVIKRDFERLERTTKNQPQNDNKPAVNPANNQNQPRPQDNINKPPPK